SRSSAEDLDDQMRSLSDSDAMALDGTYVLNRYLIWAMPILGFLGTVLGITQAIAGISPEQMEKDPGAVSTGLTNAFDATALAQALDAALTRFGQRIVDTEKKLLDRHQVVLDGLGKLAAVLKDTGRDHQLALARLIDAIGLAVEMISKTQADEKQLIRLQET